MKNVFFNNFDKKIKTFFLNKKTIFLLKFFIIFLILDFLIIVSNLSFYNSFLAFITGSFSGLKVLGNNIFLNNHIFIIDNSCTGLVSVAMLAGLIFPLKKIIFFEKIRFFIFGSVLLLLFNIFRIIFVLYSAKIGFDADFIHILTWFLMSFIVIFIWFFVLKNFFKIKDFSKII